MSIKQNPKSTSNNRNPYAFLNPKSRSKTKFDFNKLTQQRKGTQPNYNCYSVSVKQATTQQTEVKARNPYMGLKTGQKLQKARTDKGAAPHKQHRKAPKSQQSQGGKANNTFAKLQNYKTAKPSTFLADTAKYNKSNEKFKNSFLSYKQLLTPNRSRKTKGNPANSQINTTNKVKRSTHLTYINISKENNETLNQKCSTMSVVTDAESDRDREIDDYRELADRFEESFDDDYSIKQRCREELFSDISATSTAELAQKSFKKIPHCHRLSISEKGIEVIETLHKVPIMQRQVKSQTDIVVSDTRSKAILENNKLSFTDRKDSLEEYVSRFDTIKPSRFRAVNEKSLTSRVLSRSLEKISTPKKDSKPVRKLMIQPCSSINFGYFGGELNGTAIGSSI